MGKKKKKRTNPNKQPVTKASFDKSFDRGRLAGVQEDSALTIMTLCDKFGWEPEQPDPCPWCKKEFVVMTDSRHVERPQNVVFCPVCGRRKDGRDDKSIIAFWKAKESLAADVNSGRIKLKEIHEVLGEEYKCEIVQEGGDI